MRKLVLKLILATAVITPIASAAAVINTHPRLLLTAADRSRLVAKMNAADPSWQALKARADALATYTIHPYKSARSSEAPEGTIHYTYQGEGWLIPCR